MLSLFIVSSCLVALAQEDSPDEGLEQRLIKGNIAVSEWLDGVAEGLDLFLVGRKLTRKRNETNVKLGNSSYYMADGSFTNSTSLNANLRLPNLEEYWQLKFSNYDESRERGVQANYLRQTPRERNYGATVGLFKKLGNVRAAFQPRISLQNPLNVSHSLAFESVADFKAYQINPKLEFFANAEKGTGVFEALNFNFQLNPVFSLTWINEGEYEEKVHLYSTTNALALGQVITDRRSLSYSLSLMSNNRPEYHLDVYSLAISWSDLLYKSILDYQLTPHLDFLRDRGFTGMAGVTFSINLNF
jgi:hypothetical protein